MLRLLIFLCLVSPAFAQENIPLPEQEEPLLRVHPLKVRACGPMKPLVFEDGTGFAVDLWHTIMNEMGQTTEVFVDKFDPKFVGLQTRKEDVNIGGITITAEREGIVDFTQPFMRSGLRIAINNETLVTPSWTSVWTRPEIAKTIGVYLVMLAVGGVLLWVVERKAKNSNIRKLSDGIHVTQTSASTQGLGDFYPVTNLGRILIAIYFFIGAACIADIQSTLASIKTANRLTSSINSVSDLEGRQIGVKNATTSQSRANRIKSAVIRGYDSDVLLYEALSRGDIDAVIDDSPRVLYYANISDSIITVGSEFEPQEYGFAFPSGHPMVEHVSRAILRTKENGLYDDLYAKWFGDGR